MPCHTPFIQKMPLAPPGSKYEESFPNTATFHHTTLVFFGSLAHTRSRTTCYSFFWDQLLF